MATTQKVLHDKVIRQFTMAGEFARELRETADERPDSPLHNVLEEMVDNLDIEWKWNSWADREDWEKLEDYNTRNARMWFGEEEDDDHTFSESWYVLWKLNLCWS